MEIKAALKSVDWPRVFLIAINIPFLVILHIAFLAHVLVSVWFYLAFAFPPRKIYLAFVKNYRHLVIQLFKPLA